MDPNESINSVASMLQVDELMKTLSSDPPWWLFVLAALIPLSITLVVREMCCWFLKVNTAVAVLRELQNSLERIEVSLQDIRGNGAESEDGEG